MKCNIGFGRMHIFPDLFDESFVCVCVLDGISAFLSSLSFPRFNGSTFFRMGVVCWCFLLFFVTGQCQLIFRLSSHSPQFVKVSRS